MKFFKWKIWAVTSAVCLAAVLPGLALWNKLPDTLAIHFNINNEPDNFAPKWFVVFGLPILMVLLQTFCCFVNDINAHKHGERRKLELVTKWIIPVMTMLLQLLTLGIGLGWKLDVRVFAVLIVGLIFIITGNYLPKLDYIKNYKLETDNARRINRFVGFGAVIMGVLFIISIFFPPIVSVACLLLLIPYVAVCVIYAVVTAKKK